MKNTVLSRLTSLGLFVTWMAITGQTQAPKLPAQNSSKVGEDGTVFVTRIVPLPKTVSAEAQRMLARPASDSAPAFHTVEEDRAATDGWQNKAGELSRRLYPAIVASSVIAGVPVRIIKPVQPSPTLQDRVLINLHGGGFHVDSGSLTETIPIASLTGVTVVSILYRLAPEHPYPAAAEDAVEVYKELLKTHLPRHIAIYGTSAGAILTGEVTVRIRDQGLPLPVATGFFSGTGDLSMGGDSVNLYGLNGLSGYLASPPENERGLEDYIGRADPKDPELSPFYADLRGFPPTLFVTSGRDRRLSGTTLLHRAYLRAGVHAELVVFEALPHAFWNTPDLPEAREAHQMMTDFFLEYLK